MEIILRLVRKLVLVAIFASFCELLLPSGKFRSYLRFGVGLVFIALLLQPLASLKDAKFDPEELLGGVPAAGADLDSASWVQAQSQALVEDELARSVADYFALEYPNCSVRVGLDVDFDERGLLREFRGMEIELFPAGVKQIVPVIIGVAADSTQIISPPRELVRDLACYLGVAPDKLTLQIFPGG